MGDNSELMWFLIGGSIFAIIVLFFADLEIKVIEELAEDRGKECSRLDTLLIKMSTANQDQREKEVELQSMVIDLTEELDQERENYYCAKTEADYLYEELKEERDKVEYLKGNIDELVATVESRED